MNQFSDYVNAYVSPNFYIIDNVSNLKDLGIIMSTNCSFEQHIIELCKRCTGLCGWILRTFSSRESTVMMTLFKSLVLSRIDYGSQLWSPTKIHQIIMIEKIQKAFTKHIKGFSSFSYQESRVQNRRSLLARCECERLRSSTQVNIEYQKAKRHRGCLHYDLFIAQLWCRTMLKNCVGI